METTWKPYVLDMFPFDFYSGNSKNPRGIPRKEMSYAPDSRIPWHGSRAPRNGNSWETTDVTIPKGFQQVYTFGKSLFRQGEIFFL